MTNDLTHFAQCVPQNIRCKLFELANAAKDEFICDPLPNHSWLETCGEAQINEIYGRHIPGFFPYQNGGFEVNCLYRFDQDETCHFTKNQSEFMQEIIADCKKEFCREKKIEDVDKENECLWNELGEYELARLEDCYALLRLEMWVDRKENEKPIFIRLSLGYRDSPYFRAKHDETIFERQLSVEEVLSYSDVSFTNELKQQTNAALKNAN